MSEKRPGGSLPEHALYETRIEQGSMREVGFTDLESQRFYAFEHGESLVLLQNDSGVAMRM